MRFEPRNEQRPVKIDPGASIDSEGAQRVAASIREQLLNEGYRDADVTATLVPAGFRTVDLRIRVNRGPQHRVRDVRFLGDPGIEAKEIRRVFRRLPDSDAAVEPALARVRSLYVSQGYFDANVKLGRTEPNGNDVTLWLDAQPGSRYPAPSGELCRCLFDAQRRSARKGIMDFQPRLEVDGAASVRTAIEEGPPYTVGRIEFRGNHAFGDSTLRRALVLDEGALFDADRLRRSVARLNGLGLFEPMAEQDLEVRRDEAARRADITFHLREKPRGRWALSGPMVPLGIAGPFSASITSRLPGWGAGLFEVSTYSLSFSLIGLSSSVVRFMPFAPRNGILPLVSLARPLLPGQRWTSGFALSPQLGWKASLVGYGLTQTHQSFRAMLGSDRIKPPPLVAPVEWTSPSPRPAGAGALICDPSKPRAWKLRTVAATLNEFLLGVRPF